MPLRPHAALLGALLTCPANAQAPGHAAVPAAVWALCPADELPRHLAALGTAEHGAAVAALAAMGPRAHRWLAGAMRLGDGGSPVPADAFGGLGPASSWLLPTLLENVAAWRSMVTTQQLLERLGRTAKPAASLLQQQRNWPDALRLAQRLAALPDPTAPFEPMPDVAPVDAALREPLLAVLRDARQQARWWPALQALLGIDAGAAAEAAATLVLHAANGTADATEVPHLLLALRCHCAATALRSLDTAAALPEPGRSRELSGAVLAACAPLHLHGQRLVARGNARRLLAFAAGNAAERRLAALSAAMYSLLEPHELPHRHDALAALAAADDATTRSLAAFAARRADAAFDTLLAGTNASCHRLDVAQLEPEHLRRVPRRELERALAVAATADTARERQAGPGGSLAEQVLRGAQASGPQSVEGALAAYHARALLGAVAASAPELLAPLLAAPRSSRRALAAALAATQMPAALHDWWLDQQHAAITDDFAGEYMPVAVAPVLLARLRRAERLEHTIALLHSQRRYLWWHEAMDREPDAFAAAAPHVPPGLHAPFVELVTAGARRRVGERLLLAPDTAPALRSLLAKWLRGGDERHPPSDAFVRACVESSDPLLTELALAVARHATDSRERVAALLLERLPGADEQARRAIAGALHRLGSPAAEALLREQLRSGTPVLQRDAAIALAGAPEPDPDAMAFLRAGIVSSDVEDRRQIWRWISFSPEVAPRFVDAALAELTKGGDVQDAMRLRALLATAAKMRRAETLALVERLTRHRDDEVANMAVNLLQQFDQLVPAPQAPR
jgi:hypothetical protein